MPVTFVFCLLLLVTLPTLNFCKICTPVVRTGVVNFSPKQEFAITTPHGSVNLQLNRIVRIVTFNEIIQCPNTNNLNDAITIIHNYHCESGAGSPQCGKTFGGWDSEQKNKIRNNTYFVGDVGSGAGSCFAIWDASYCFGLTPRENIEHISIVKLITTNCQAVIKNKGGTETTYGFNGDYSSVLNNEDVKINFQYDCEPFPTRYAAYSEGTLVYQEQAKILNFASDGCPIYKDGKEWTINQAHWQIERLYKNDWKYSATWLGHIDVKDGIRANKVDENIVVQEEMTTGRLYYRMSTTNCTDIDFVTLEGQEECVIRTCVYKNHAHDLGTQGYKAQITIETDKQAGTGKGFCWINELNGESKQVKAKGKTLVTSGKVEGETTFVTLGGRKSTQCQVNIPSPVKEQSYGHDLVLEDDGPTSNFFGSGLGIDPLSYLGHFESVLPIILIVLIVITNPIILRTKIGQIAILGLAIWWIIRPAHAIEMEPVTQTGIIMLIVPSILSMLNLTNPFYITSIVLVVAYAYVLKDTRYIKYYKFFLIIFQFFLSGFLTVNYWHMFSILNLISLMSGWNEWLEVMMPGVYEAMNDIMVTLYPSTLTTTAWIRHHGITIEGKLKRIIRGQRMIGSLPRLKEKIIRKHYVREMRRYCFYKSELNKELTDFLSTLTKDDCDHMIKYGGLKIGREEGDLRFLEKEEIVYLRTKKNNKKEKI